MKPIPEDAWLKWLLRQSQIVEDDLRSRGLLTPEGAESAGTFPPNNITTIRSAIELRIKGEM